MGAPQPTAEKGRFVLLQEIYSFIAMKNCANNLRQTAATNKTSTKRTSTMVNTTNMMTTVILSDSSRLRKVGNPADSLA